MLNARTIHNESEKFVEITRHHNGARAFDPKEKITHGTTGWYKGTKLIFNTKWKKPGWYTVRDYRIVKVRSGEYDYRVDASDLYNPSRGLPFAKTKYKNTFSKSPQKTPARFPDYCFDFTTAMAS